METVVIDKVIFIGFGSLISILLIVIGYFIRSTHQDIKGMVKMINTHDVSIAVIEERIETHERVLEKIDNNKIAELMYAKLKAAQG